ncbi:MAG: DUF3048 domain-containing protein [Candidatus Aquicultor sp.]|nr:DUF3048 domain-containing protein [Candidatus Aquicultor sp.]
MKPIYIILAILLSLLLMTAVSATVIWPLVNERPVLEDEQAIAQTPTTTTTEAPQPEFPCPIDGEYTHEPNATRRPLAVMIENHVDARPQSGLSDACVVYETVAEGGITRFMAVFLHEGVATIGPVRSAREYFVDLARAYNALYVHCGGPATVYEVIKNLDVADLDEFANSEAYWRIKKRKAPHNLYTSTEKLWSKAKDRGFESQVFYQKPNFKDDDAPELRPSNASINLDFSKPEFRVHYEYDRNKNTYNRFMAGQPHKDAANNELISAKNVVVQYVPVAKIADDPKGRMQLNLRGTGQAMVFQDGRVIFATWQRQTVSEITRYFDSAGSEIKFNRGQTWIELVDPATMRVDYQ